MTRGSNAKKRAAKRGARPGNKKVKKVKCPECKKMQPIYLETCSCGQRLFLGRKANGSGRKKLRRVFCGKK